MKSIEDVEKAQNSSADMVLIDSGKGSGKVFDWELLSHLKRDYILAGGLGIENVSEAVETLHPFAVDVSSGDILDIFATYGNCYTEYYRISGTDCILLRKQVQHQRG